MKSLLAEGEARRGGRGGEGAYASTFAGISKCGEGPIDFRSEFEQEGKPGSKASGIWENFPARPGETFRQPEMETLAPLFRSTGRRTPLVSVSFPPLSYFLLPLLSFFFILSRSFGFRSRWCLVFNTDWTWYFCYFIGRCQNADPREQFGNRDDARKIDDLRDELQADDADQSYV